PIRMTSSRISCFEGPHAMSNKDTSAIRIFASLFGHEDEPVAIVRTISLRHLVFMLGKSVDVSSIRLEPGWLRRDAADMLGRLDRRIVGKRDRQTNDLIAPLIRHFEDRDRRRGRGFTTVGARDPVFANVAVLVKSARRERLLV